MSQLASVAEPEPAYTMDTQLFGGACAPHAQAHFLIHLLQVLSYPPLLPSRTLIHKETRSQTSTSTPAYEATLP